MTDFRDTPLPLRITPTPVCLDRSPGSSASYPGEEGPASQPFCILAISWVFALAWDQTRTTESLGIVFHPFEIRDGELVTRDEVVDPRVPPRRKFNGCSPPDCGLEVVLLHDHVGGTRSWACCSAEILEFRDAVLHVPDGRGILVNLQGFGVSPDHPLLRGRPPCPRPGRFPCRTSPGVRRSAAGSYRCIRHQSVATR